MRGRLENKEGKMTIQNKDKRGCRGKEAGIVYKQDYYYNQKRPDPIIKCKTPL